jgi:DNA-directed RNA polymerase specialized sigma24 family protein
MGEGANQLDATAGTVTRWIGDLKAGDDRALGPLWDRYFERLARRARKRLRASGGPTAVRDEEDVALSAFRLLAEGARAGRFPQLENREDLWRVLLHLAASRAVDAGRRERRQKRGGGAVLREADLVAGEGGGGRPGPLDRAAGRELSPGFAAEVAEECRLLLDALGDPRLRRIAERKLAGCTSEEIAGELGVSLRTVTLKLKHIRMVWQEREGAP